VPGLGWFAAEDLKEGEVIWFMESWLEDKVTTSLQAESREKLCG
jgi:hypothetical protein